MFRATMCQSSGENTVPMRHLVLVTPYSHLYRVTNTRRRIGTVFPPDDGHIVARNIQRRTINVLRKSVYQAGSIYKIILNLISEYSLPPSVMCLFASSHKK